MNSQEINFGLRKITTSQFATVDSAVIQEKSIGLNYGFGFGVNEENKIVACNAKFEFISKKTPFIVLDVLCEFEISPNSWNNFLNKGQGTITLPVALITHLAVITVGTARGILHCKTENTKFNKYFLPTINVTESIKTDISIKINI